MVFNMVTGVGSANDILSFIIDVCIIDMLIIIWDL